MSDDIHDAVMVLWNYMQLKQVVEPADVLLVLGSRDDRVASHAAMLLQQGFAHTCVVSGGLVSRNDLLISTWTESSEAEHFAVVMKAAGIGGQKLLIEDSATNTGENATYSHKVLMEAEVEAASILLVTKPYMERRALATFQLQWPDRTVRLRVTSQGGTIEQYCNEQQRYEDVVNLMAGDFQRIVEYPKRGLQVAQHIPASTMKAFEVLTRAGFTECLLS